MPRSAPMVIPASSGSDPRHFPIVQGHNHTRYNTMNREHEQAVRSLQAQLKPTKKRAQGRCKENHTTECTVEAYESVLCERNFQLESVAGPRTKIRRPFLVFQPRLKGLKRR